MDFRRDGDSINGGDNGNFATGLMAGSMVNRDDDRGKSTTMMMVVLAVIFFVIIFIIALVFLALAFKDRREALPPDYYSNKNNNVGELLTGLAAVKSMDGNSKNGEIDRLEIMQKLEHNEDRATQRETQREIQDNGKAFAQIGFGLSGQINQNEKDTLKEFGEIKATLGMQSQALSQILQKANNADIINGVVLQLTGRPCIA